jgi:hypothetical protein
VGYPHPSWDTPVVQGVADVVRDTATTRVRFLA